MSTACGGCCFGGAGEPDRSNDFEAIAAEVRRLHTERAKPFDSVGQVHLLVQIWDKLRPGEEFVPVGDQWKAIGFQGRDPTTDVRAGGLLAMQLLHQFVLMHTKGLQRMLVEVNRASAKTADHYYPVCCTGVVACSALCDEIGLSDGMRGAVALPALDALVAAPLKSPLAPFLLGAPEPKRSSLSKLASFAPGHFERISRHPETASGASVRRTGFAQLFALLLADFHIRFISESRTYMGCQALLTECIERLRKRAAGVTAKGGAHFELWSVYVKDAQLPVLSEFLTEPVSTKASRRGSCKSDAHSSRRGSHMPDQTRLMSASVQASAREGESAHAGGACPGSAPAVAPPSRARSRLSLASAEPFQAIGASPASAPSDLVQLVVGGAAAPPRPSHRASSMWSGLSNPASSARSSHIATPGGCAGATSAEARVLPDRSRRGAVVQPVSQPTAVGSSIKF